jgi:protoporphyrinogen IX oxidase
MYLYIKALHIIFIVTWFAGLFYIVRLFIYNREANDKPEPERSILQSQLGIMSRRLWYGITWPSAILTLIFGPLVMFKSNWHLALGDEAGRWLLVKLILVLLLYIYHYSLHRLFKQQSKGDFRYSSQQLRLWNEVATVFLVAIVILASVKQSVSLVWGLAGLVIFIMLLLISIRVYKLLRG